MNLFPLNRRSSFRNLLISLKVNKQKKKKKNSVFASSSWFRCDFCISFSKDKLVLPDPPPPHLPWFLFILLLSFLFRSSFSSPEANDYDEEDEAGNPLTVDEGGGKLISDGACAINLRLDRFIPFRWSVAYSRLCFLKLTVPRHGLFELYSGSYDPDFLNDFKAILTE